MEQQDQENIQEDSLKQQVIEALKTIFDPEIPVNIYDLGLIYEVSVNEVGDADIKMTLTTPACPVAQTFPTQIEQEVAQVEGIDQVHVELVWDPPWTHDSMSEEGRLQMGMYNY